MKQYQIKYWLIACILFCSTAVPLTATAGTNIHGQPKDTPVVQKTVIRFLNWYKVNLNKANSFKLLVKDSSDFYMVNKSAVKDYLSFMKSSGYLSETYISYWKVYFDDKTVQLEKEKLQSDMPEGFDFDFVLITQEPDLLLKQISKIKFKTVSSNSKAALLNLKWPGKIASEYEFEMQKGKAGWQIDYISTPNYD